MKALILFFVLTFFGQSIILAQSEDTLSTSMGSSIEKNIEPLLIGGSEDETPLTAKANKKVTTPILIGFCNVVKFDIAGLITKELAFEYEKKKREFRSSNIRAGIKIHPKTAFEVGISQTRFTKIQKDSRTSLFVLFSDNGSSSRYEGEERPFAPLINDFIPQLSFQFNKGLRFYEKNQKKTKFYFEGTLLSSLQKGLRVKEEVRSTIVSNTSNSSPYTPFSLIFSSSSTSQEVLYTQTRRINDDLKIIGGLALSTGAQFSIKQKTFVDVQLEAGSNFFNGLDKTYDYSNGKVYGKIKLMIGLGR